MNRKFLSLIIISILIVVYNFDTNIKKRIGFINYDYFQTLFEENFSTNKIVIIDIDETSIENIGQFPWRRDVYSKILNNLNLAETSVIAFDIFLVKKILKTQQKFFRNLI